ncbi:phage tail protein [Nitrosomonas sp. PY1]|uniref:phage tail tube protein n=1 Tax=Nitrosomonas sp. PY1 TaxID=1803906 RepID=UPI001FC8508A|nr:phage tail tube protein [Nitrosomonas sp. PY1]GKS68994.1 phage tail protein [Nitrosomonas sp. PY1]
MANAQVLRNAVVQIQNTLGVAKTITGISKAAEAVITGTHDFAVGDLIVLSNIQGMTELNDRVVRVKSVSTTVSFVAEELDSTGFSTYVSGGIAQKVTGLLSFDNITQLSIPEQQPNEIDVTTIHDNEKQTIFGQREAPKATFTLIADPLAVTSKEMAKADATATRRVIKIKLISGYTGIFNAFVSGGAGFDGSAGAVPSASASFTLRGVTQWFAS